MADRTLAELLQQAEQLTRGPTSHGDLQRVDRSLQQILHTGEPLFSRSSQVPANDAQASILLGARGLDLPQFTQRLESLRSCQTLQPLDPIADTDIEAFLKNERDNAIITAVEDAKRRTRDHVDRLYWEQQKADWEQTKQNLLSTFTHSATDMLSITMHPQEALSSGPRRAGSGSSLSSEESAYARVVMEYNEEVLQGGIRPHLAEGMSQAVETMKDQTIKELWSIVRFLCEVPVSICGDTAKARASTQVQSALVQQGRVHLQNSYMEHMTRMVYHQLERAQLGGTPGLVPLVIGYLKVILQPQMLASLEDGTAQGVPVWPLIFYCLRTGGVKAARTAAADNSCPAVAEIVSVLSELERSEFGRLSMDSEKKLKLSYKRGVKNSPDVFKRAVYCILSRSDVQDDHADICSTTDDYLWLKLCQVECEPTGPQLPDQMSLTQLQIQLSETYGESHFNAWQQPTLYATVLFLTGQFEAAIEFLSRLEHLRCHAVHLALALHEMNLLALSTQTNAPMVSREKDDAAGIRRLNLTRLILVYTSKFEATDPCEALHYCYFLRNLKDATGQNMFLNCIRELVIKTHDCDTLLGRLEVDNRRIPGLADKFKIDVSELTEMVAKDSEKKGLFEDAIKLYDLAKNHEKVVQLLNQLLGQVVHMPEGGSGSKRQRVLTLAGGIALRFRTHGHRASTEEISTLHLMLDLASFFDLQRQDRHLEAIEVMKKLRLIALTREEVDARVAAIAGMGIEIRTLLPHVLLAAMTATHHLYRQQPQIGSPMSGSIGNASFSGVNVNKQLQDRARAIVTFAGMIPMRLHADVHARLVQLEALIN